MNDKIEEIKELCSQEIGNMPVHIERTKILALIAEIERLQTESLRYLQDLNDRTVEAERLEKENDSAELLKKKYLCCLENYTKVDAQLKLVDNQNTKLQRVYDCTEELGIEFIIRLITPFPAPYCVDVENNQELEQIEKLKKLQQALKESKQ